MLHAHMAFWIVGSPRIDHIVVPKQMDESTYEITAQWETDVVVPQTEAANRMASFWDRVFCEFNVAKAMKHANDIQALPDAAHEENAKLMRGDVGTRQKLGKKKEKEQSSPETLSYKTLAHCLLGCLDMTEIEEGHCWDELNHIVQNCSRNVNASEPALGSPGATEEEKEQRRAHARKLFVAALAEWVNMHDLHKPYALGPPGKDQACAAVENEHSSTKEKVYCNKFFPRKCVEVGCEEIAEDPRRHELYRLWLSRNCHFINNFVPVVLLAMLSNMDFQATLTKEAVIEYMTKYITKSGQASLFKVMENSFSLCIEKAREKMQGSGSAVLRWFNLQSITEVKSQLETMHLLFKAPRFICTREFKDIYLRSEMRQGKTREQIAESKSKDESIVNKSVLEAYWSRHEWKLPDSKTLQSKHPSSRLPLWLDILKTVGSPVLDSDAYSDYCVTVESVWPEYLKLLSRWQLTRYFKRSRGSVTCKTHADVVVVHPAPMFTTAKEESQWLDACRWMLLAYCNHGECCATTTFKHKDHLDSFSEQDLRALAESFVMTPARDRLRCGLTPCPPHVRKNWLLGVARRQREEERKHSKQTVTKAMPDIKFVFEDETCSWNRKAFSDMTSEEQDIAKRAWYVAEEEEEAIAEEEAAKVSEADAGISSNFHVGGIRSRMKKYMTSILKWSHRELHDCLIAAGLDLPIRPSLISYFNILRLQFADNQLGFLPQSKQSHSKKRIQSILRILGRTGLKLGGKLADAKPVLIERLAHWLNKVVEAGREPEGADNVEEHEESDGD